MSATRQLKIVDEYFGPGGTERRPAVELRLVSERITAREIIRGRIEAEVEALNARMSADNGGRGKTRSFLIDMAPDSAEGVLNAPRPLRRKPTPADFEREAARAFAEFERQRAWIAPRLSIADQLEVTDKFLIVRGRRHEYAIHFGSSNIQIRPGNRYLCIVPDGAPTEATGVKLPFTGDGMLSTILAKAFLLADERKITDRTILNQL